MWFAKYQVSHTHQIFILHTSFKPGGRVRVRFMSIRPSFQCFRSHKKMGKGIFLEWQPGLSGRKFVKMEMGVMFYQEKLHSSTFRSKNMKVLTTWRRYLHLNLFSSCFFLGLNLWVSKNRHTGMNVSLWRALKSWHLWQIISHHELRLWSHSVGCIVSLFITDNWRQWCFLSAPTSRVLLRILLTSQNHRCLIFNQRGV